uniref:Reverse transcriptase Ty1/copia-type domain-containing protein n=1 Tax=Tanacetum cinerariifolium TaxID=118510 RepID=A0A699J027_TANCI|nr:hypothetical protein [Tanacetum cinerariifolium]
MDSRSIFSSSSKDSPGDRFKPLGEEEKKDDEDPWNKDNKVLSTEEPRVNQENDVNTQDLLFSYSLKDSLGNGFKPSGEEEKKDSKDLENKDNKVISTDEPRVNQKKDVNVNNTNNINTISPTDNAAGIEENVVDENIVYGCVDDLNMPKWRILAYLKTPIKINKARLVAHGHTKEEGIDYDEIFAPVVRIKAIRQFLAYASFKDFMVYQMDVKSAFLYREIEEEVYGCQPSGSEDLDFPNKVYKVEKALHGLHQAPRACQDKYVDETLKKYGFLTVKTASTPMETSKPLMKDEIDKDMDVHLYRSMIGSLMYLTSSRPNIMFDVCACARFQVTPKVSHLHAVKRIFRYLKG